ncbi:receptor-like protein EIX2 [Bidens hawaiensis]|uniref:receptor-like protein EIX2 n=1 Tax=Bidens hawaiensis TaxID=980011 RepID=UPI004048F13B
MRNTYSGWRIRLDFICIFLVALAHKCLGSGNLTTPSCPEQERLALLMFKHSVKEDHGMLSSWGLDNDIDCCKWARVNCDVSGSVVSLHLRGYANEDHHLVADEVSSCFTNLVNLKHLDLSGNNFRQSQIPKFIGETNALRYLNLSKAGFSGNIPPQIGNLSNLEALDVSSQFINDQLMTNDIEWISGLSKLEHLSLSRVNLSGVQNLDNVLYMIPSLSKLILSDCGLHMAQLSSRHLNSSRELASIKHVDLSGNDFRGQLHGLFLNMTSLAFLDLLWNNFSMPSSFENLLNMIPHVSELHLASCSIENINLSPINSNISKHSNIQHLYLQGNEIEGMFPSILINMSSLLSLDLSGNKFNSFIPVMPNLHKLDMSANNLRKSEDVGIWEQCHLKELIVSHNELEGNMIGPSTNVSKCSQNALEILYLSNNRLNGSIPESFGRLTNLLELDLSFNDFTGPIPEALGNLISLQRLDISNNQLTSSIPESLGRLTTFNRNVYEFKPVYRLHSSIPRKAHVVGNSFVVFKFVKWDHSKFNWKTHQTPSNRHFGQFFKRSGFRRPFC